MCVRHLIFLLAGSVIIPVGAAAARPSRIEVVARIYNTARVADTVRDAALHAATRALAGGAIQIAWRDCDRSEACSVAPASSERVIRLVRSVDAFEQTAAFVLGEASIDRRAGVGVLATIYVNRVESMADQSQTDAAMLLGRTIAHELGHLLLATNAHSASGLMRAQWTPGDIRRNQLADWVLTKGDAAAIRQRLR